MFEDQRSTVLAVDNMNGASILGRTIRVSPTLRPSDIALGTEHSGRYFVDHQRSNRAHWNRWTTVGSTISLGRRMRRENMSHRRNRLITPCRRSCRVSGLAIARSIDPTLPTLLYSTFLHFHLFLFHSLCLSQIYHAGHGFFSPSAQLVWSIN
jgi:hypothetical protein